MASIESRILGLVISWVGFVIGLIIGWAWKPKWASFGRKTKLSCSVSESSDCSVPSSPSRSINSRLEGFKSAPCLKALACDPRNMAVSREDVKPSFILAPSGGCSMSRIKDKSNIVTEEDLRDLAQLVEMKDGGPAWIQMMDRFMPNMRYQAWWREPKTGPIQYRSRTAFEDATPEMLRDFFWDDEFRARWDSMLAHSDIIEECLYTGTMVVKWIRKFPFFCSDREYIIGRRIWECGRSFYCVTKGISLPSIPRRNKPRRVDLFYSSWYIRPVESRRGDGQMTACEVLLFHHEDMGIPKEIAKLGVRQGMWGVVKRMEPGLRAYQKQRASGAKLSRYSFMAQINTKVPLEYLNAVKGKDNKAETELAVQSDGKTGGNIPKLLIFGGTVLLACTVDNGILLRAIVFGVGRTLANLGKKP